MGIWPILRSKIPVKKASLGGWTAPFGFAQHLNDEHRRIQRDRQDIAGFYGMGGLSRRVPIDADMAAFHQFGRL